MNGRRILDCLMQGLLDSLSGHVSRRRHLLRDMLDARPDAYTPWRLKCLQFSGLSSVRRRLILAHRVARRARERGIPLPRWLRERLGEVYDELVQETPD